MKHWLLQIALASSLLFFAEVSLAKGKPGQKKRPEPPTLTEEGLPNVLSAAAVVIDLETGEELFAKEADTPRAIASISKLAAVLAVRSRGIELEGVTRISSKDAAIARRGARPHLRVGWQLTNRDLLFSVLIASENRAVPALGRGAGLSPGELVSAMNEVAAELGLEQTRFDETTGLSYNNKSTAREVAKLLEAAMKDELLAEAMRQGSFQLHPVAPETRVVIRNTNRLTRAEGYTVLGGKTGFNNKAGLCLATALELEGRRVLIVLLGARTGSTRYADVERIASWLRGSQREVASHGALPSDVVAGSH